MPKYGMTIDLERCMGCRACVEACKVENNTGQNMYWMYVFRIERGKYPDSFWFFMPRPCMHCDNAPCVKVCPVGARHKREDGLVLTDYERCIGCRYCEVACPYSVNYFNWKKPASNQYYTWKEENIYGSGKVALVTAGAVPPYRNPDHDKLYGISKKRLVSGGGHSKGVMEKCTFCVHRLEKGLLPACVANCPVKVFTFGDLSDPKSEVSRVAADRSAFRLLENAGTEPRVFYLHASEPDPLARLGLTEIRRTIR
ncbi:MAG: hypothetical protein HW414_671 [Dehalococcoidia bacterium]|nr:hypothetical protein [Dehalococcoidia bacterium]